MGVLTEIIDSYQWTNFLNPNNIKGLSAFSMLLAMIGNGLMIPRALFIRDFMWYVSSPTQNLMFNHSLKYYCCSTLSSYQPPDCCCV